MEAFRHVVKYAIRKRLLKVDPFVGFERLAATPRRRGTFTADEVTRLLSLGSEAWTDSRSRLFVALAACTGLRKGELQALRRQSVQELTICDGRQIGILRVDSSWERSGHLKGTKSGKVRNVAIPPALYMSLHAVMAEAPWQDPDSFIAPVFHVHSVLSLSAPALRLSDH
jgi:integrase